MLYSENEIIDTARTYCEEHSLEIRKILGRGLQGIVFYVSDSLRENALKIHHSQTGFERELACYKRLADKNVSRIKGFNVPNLLNWDVELRAIEMSIVPTPFILDFGGAYLDRLPDHVGVEIERQEDFGEQWPLVVEALAELEAIYGIFISDINAGNIRFEDFNLAGK